MICRISGSENSGSRIINWIYSRNFNKLICERSTFLWCTFEIVWNANKGQWWIATEWMTTGNYCGIFIDRRTKKSDDNTKETCDKVATTVKVIKKEVVHGEWQELVVKTEKQKSCDKQQKLKILWNAEILMRLGAFLEKQTNAGINYAKKLWLIWRMQL